MTQREGEACFLQVCGAAGLYPPPGWKPDKTVGHGAPVLSSVLACLSLLGAWARSQLNKMWQETMNQGGEGIKEVKLTSGSKSLSLSFQACSGLGCPQLCLSSCSGRWVVAVRTQGWLGTQRRLQERVSFLQQYFYRRGCFLCRTLISKKQQGIGQGCRADVGGSFRLPGIERGLGSQTGLGS
ncbi:hypothetical protein Cadr_000007331 [Camelus dromedarius]|uniref:Uncharacterized protein n=1 Tax=Camelus dromedarius TaxID=9838 RepID=A0A5N4E5R2_CAMDR|nr:hypothetical protein Cadr_000007331 [Camelus dromedarius]